MLNRLLRNPRLRFMLLAEGDAGAGGDKGGGGGGGDKGGAGGGGDKGGGAGDPWYQSHVATLDKDTLGWLDGKKFGSVTDALKSGAASDKMARERNVVAKPDPAKLGEWDGWGALGWDADRSKYATAIKPPKQPNDGKHDVGMFDDAIAIGHELKIPPSMVEGFVQKMSDKVNARLQEVGNQGRAATEKLETDLRTAWGTEYDANTELARRAAKALGVGADDSSEIEKIVGNVRLLKLFNGIGKKLGEANLVGADGLGGTAGMTPASAQAEIRRLEGDKEFMKAYQSSRDPGHKDAAEKMLKLMGIAAKGGNTQATAR